MLPLLVFVVVDGIFTNTVVSIVSAIIFAVAQMGITWWQTGSPDYLILIDVALIVTMGVISIFLKNDIFFKLKPAIIEAISVLLIIALAFAPDTFIINYFGRFMPKGMGLQPAMIPMMKMLFIGTALYTLFHIGAVCYTAYFSSRKVWAMVAGPGYFLLFIPIMGVILFKRFKKKRAVSATEIV